MPCPGLPVPARGKQHLPGSHPAIAAVLPCRLGNCVLHRLKAPAFGALTPASLQSCMAPAGFSTGSRSHLPPASARPARTTRCQLPLQGWS